MKRFVLVVTAVLLLAAGAFGQARTAERVVDTPFSGLAPGLPDDSIRYVINGVPGTTPCQAGGTGALAVKVAGVWYCPRLTAGSGTGDVLGPSASSTGEMVLFADVTGKNITRSNSLSGVALLTSGVVSTLSTTGTGNVVRAEAPTLVSAALLTPFIASFVNAGHTHDGGAGGGANMYPDAKNVGRWVFHGWHVVLAYIISFLVLLAVMGWHPTPKRGDAPVTPSSVAQPTEAPAR